MITKLRLSLLIAAFSSFCLFGCIDIVNKEVTINEVTKMKDSDVTKIVFSDGRGKNKPFTLKDKMKINEFLKMIDGYVIKKESKHEEIKGWINAVDFYNGDKKLASITFSNPLKIDGVYYDIVKGQLSTEKIENFIKSINPDWKLQ
jgi:hypothetical protein